MAYQPIEKLLPKANYSIYTLVKMAAKRAMELADGKPPLIDHPSSKKTATIAIEEILEGKVGLRQKHQNIPIEHKKEDRATPEPAPEPQEQSV